MQRVGAWALALLLVGCSGAEVGRWAFKNYVGAHIHCQVPAVLDFPETVVLDLGQDDTAAGRIGGIFATAMLGESVEAKVGKVVKQAALPLRQSCASALQRQVLNAALFGTVDTAQGDVRLGWGVSQWGVRKTADGRIEPVLDLQASLSVPGIGVVWRATRSVQDLGQAAKEKAQGLSLVVLAAGPKQFQAVLDACVNDLGGQLLADLAEADPKRRFRID
jgi:hypothetical protein